MADATSALTAKLGPLPAWAWLGGAGVLAFLLLRGRSSSTAAQPAPAAGATPATSPDYSLGYTQGLQAANVQGAAPAATTSDQTPPAPLWQFGPPPSDPSKYVWRLTALGLQSNPGYQSGQVYPGSNSSKPGTQYGWQWAEVPAGWTADTYARSLLGAIGGAARSIGSRAANLWNDAHPLIGSPVRMPHYVRAVGGPAAHPAQIARIARQAAMHPARVQMLNPEHTGWVRVA